ncbi:hypothetical protein HRED_01721 [Candidatus Haloredivivus sp. G17]|nr:hypothetical protein HRED_01721 [Candidatus Haloredivivus sp. G17]
MVQQEAGAAGFSTLLETMAQLDFFTLVLPFILSYVVFLFAIRKVPLFQDSNDEPEQGIPEIIAVISAFFAAQFIAANPWYQTFFVDYFGRITIGVIGILGLMILLGLIGLDFNIFTNPAMVIIMIAVVGAAFTASGGFGPPIFSFDAGILTDTLGMLIDTGLIWLLVIAGVIAFTATENDGGGDSTLLEQLFEDIG